MFIKSISSNFKQREAIPYYMKIPAITKLDRIDLNNPVTIIVGENGTGKSTLIEAIAVNYGLNPEGGGKNFNFATKHSHAGLFEEIRLGKIGVPNDTFFLRAEGFYNVATEIERLNAEDGLLLNSYGGKSLHDQSHGESFLSLLKYRFRAKGLYILDEPESALSPMRQMSMIVRINDLVKRGSQFIIATHSPIIMAYPNADIIQLNDNGYERIDYRETEHYIVTKAFIDKPEKMIETLLE
ncbi:AAA family ATPase [Macrococcus animalis]|uniref:AAA family ATPase n=1 Tax=Macrococcus animalis TaxID=3395467 RepID=UPI0039BDB56A